MRGITDLDVDRAVEVASRHGIELVYPDLQALLGDETVEVVDVAVPADRQPAIVEASRAGKHVLAQKPFAPDVATGARLVELAHERGRVLAVNQQLRFDEGPAAAYAMIERGWIGYVCSLSISVDVGNTVVRLALAAGGAAARDRLPLHPLSRSRALVPR